VIEDIARALEPLIREHAAAIEEGRVPPPLVDALYDAGVFKAMLPRELGGLEAEPVRWLQMIEELSRINASVGWLAFIQSGIGLTFLDPGRYERFRERGGGRLILAMNLGRMAGKAVKVEGGYRISGRWPFASGSPFATWLGGLSVVCDPDGSPVMRVGPPAPGEHLHRQGGEGGGRPHLRDGRLERRVPGPSDRASVPRHQHRREPHQLRGHRVYRDRLLLPDQRPRRRPGDRRPPVLVTGPV
jgi:hypothetical protein